MKKVIVWILAFLLIVSSVQALSKLDNLEAYWQHDLTGSILYDVHNDRNLTRSGTVATQNGVINNGRGAYETSTLSLGTPTGYFSNTTIFDSGLSNFSASFWVNVTNIAGDNDMWIFSKDVGGGTVYASCVILQAQYKLRCVLSSNGFNGEVYADLPSLNDYHHVVFINDEQVGKSLYVNGQLKNTSADTEGFPATTGQEFTIGMRGIISFNYGGLQGYTDEFGVWSRPLTSVEVQELYNSGNGLDYDLFNASGLNLTVIARDIEGNNVNNFNITLIQDNGTQYFYQNTTGNVITTGIPFNISSLINYSAYANTYLSINNNNVNVSSGLLELEFRNATSKAYFYDDIGADISSRDILINYPNGASTTVQTDSNGVATWSSIVSGNDIYGNYSITFSNNYGYVSPQTFYINMTPLNAPINISREIERTKLNITIYDVSNSSLITQLVDITIQGIGTFNTTTGNIIIINPNITANNYTMFTVSNGYRLTQQTFSYSGTQNTNVNIYMLPTNDTNAGNLIAIVYDEFYNTQSAVDVRLLEYNGVLDSNIEVGQCYSNSNGECYFGIELGVKSYIITATKTIDGVTYTAQSSPTGEIIFIDNYEIELFLFTEAQFEVDTELGLYANIYNKTLVNNVSYLTAQYYDIYNNNHTVCIEYSWLNGLNTTSLTKNCISGASGTVNVLNGYLLNRSRNNLVEVYTQVDGIKQTTLFSYIYTSDESLEQKAGYMGIYIILLAFIIALGISIHAKNIILFGIFDIILSIVGTIIFPSLIDWKIAAVIIMLGIFIIYMGRKIEGNQIV